MICVIRQGVGDRERKSIAYYHSEGITAVRVPAHYKVLAL